MSAIQELYENRIIGPHARDIRYADFEDLSGSYRANADAFQKAFNEFLNASRAVRIGGQNPETCQGIVELQASMNNGTFLPPILFDPMAMTTKDWNAFETSFQEMVSQYTKGLHLTESLPL